MKVLKLQKKLNNKVNSVVTCGFSAIEKNMPNELEFIKQINSVKNQS